MNVVQGNWRRKVDALLAIFCVDSISMTNDTRYTVRNDTVDCPAIVLSHSIAIIIAITRRVMNAEGRFLPPSSLGE